MNSRRWQSSNLAISTVNFHNEQKFRKQHKKLDQSVLRATVKEPKENNNDSSSSKTWTLIIRRVLLVLLHHFGMMIIVVVYVVSGAFLFQHLEQTNERNACLQSRKKLLLYLNETVHRILAVNRAKLNMEETIGNYTHLLTNFAEVGFMLIYDPTQNCSTLGEPGNNFRWSIGNSILFCVTVITTVGYGYISPRTFWGRLVCLVYGTLGIPLMLLWLANVGDVMADFFRFLYWRICCCGLAGGETVSIELMAISGSASVNKFNQDNTNDQPPPGHVQQKHLQLSHLDVRCHTKSPLNQVPPPHEVVERSATEISDDPDPNSVELPDLASVNVPITVSVTILGLYLVLGSVLFSIWEDWNTVEAVYFSFITLSTIGFGDFVPGKNGFDEYEAQVNMVCAAIYMVVGMSILSMCFNLVQDELSTKFHWIGKKLGLVESASGCVGDDDQMFGEGQGTAKLGPIVSESTV